MEKSCTNLNPCIDIVKNPNGLPLMRLNTSFTSTEDVHPINELRSSKNKGRKKKVKLDVSQVIVQKTEIEVETGAVNPSNMP